MSQKAPIFGEIPSRIAEGPPGGLFDYFMFNGRNVGMSANLLSAPSLASLAA